MRTEEGKKELIEQIIAELGVASYDDVIFVLAYLTA